MLWALAAPRLPPALPCMANPQLHASTLVLGFLHLLLLALLPRVPRLFALNIVCGVFASLWNHGTTSAVAKWADRGMMALGAAVDAAYLVALPLPHRGWLLRLIGAAILGYFLAKRMVAAGGEGARALLEGRASRVSASEGSLSSVSASASPLASPVHARVSRRRVAAATAGRAPLACAVGAPELLTGVVGAPELLTGGVDAPQPFTTCGVDAPKPCGVDAPAPAPAPAAHPCINAPHLAAHVLLSATHFAMFALLAEHCAGESMAVWLCR